MPMKPFQMAMARKSYPTVNIRQGRDDAPEVLCAAFFIFFEQRIFLPKLRHVLLCGMNIQHMSAF